MVISAKNSNAHYDLSIVSIHALKLLTQNCLKISSGVVIFMVYKAFAVFVLRPVVT